MLFAGVAAAYLQVHAETRMGDMAGYSLTLTGDCEVMGVFRVYFRFEPVQVFCNKFSIRQGLSCHGQPS